MTNFTTLSNSHTCTQNVEFSLPNNANFSSGSPRTTTGYVGVRIDLTTLVAGDLCEVRIYSGVNGGTLTSQDVATVDVAQIYLIWPMLVTNGWDFSVKITTATSRVVQWDVIQDTNDVNMNSVTAGAIAAAAFASGAITSTVIAASAIGASQIASAAITAAKFATDALDANALAASAVTEIQTGLATSGSITTLQTSATDIQARLPAALVGGKISSDVGSWLGTAAAAPTVAGIPKVEEAALRISVVDIQSRLPTALDGSGNIKASIQSFAIGIIDSIVNTIFNFEIEPSAPLKARTFVQRLRINWSILAAAAQGLAISTSGLERFRDAANTKDRATFTLDPSGTRIPGTFDGDL